MILHADVYAYEYTTPGSVDNKGILHSCQVARSRASYSLVSNTGHTLPSQLGEVLLNTLTASLQRVKNPLPTSVLDITLNNLMARFQK